MSLNCGNLLDNSNYRVIKLLGKGSMGNVYLVERVKDDKKFVVKELIFTKALGIEEKTAREIFFREAGFMGKFEHAGIPKIYGVFSQDGKDYLIMDYIEGKSLEDIISSEKKIPREKAVRWTIELADILDYLHNSFHTPIVYRDLKPSNIIITPEEKVKLVDFGIARYYNPDKNTDTFSYGSPGYAAPEQYKGRGQSTPQSDVFGLGVILFQMLTGYDPTLKPFTFPSMNLFDAELEDSVLRAIALDPLKRYINVNEFKETLEKYSGIYKSSHKKDIPFAFFSKIMIVIAIVGALFFNLFADLSMRNWEPLSAHIWARFKISVIVFFWVFIVWYLATLPVKIKDWKKLEFSLLTRLVFMLSAGVGVIISFIGFMEDPEMGAPGCLFILFSSLVVACLIWSYLKAWGYMIYSIRISSNVWKVSASVCFIAFIVFLFSVVPLEAIFLILIWILVASPFMWSVVHLLYVVVQWFLIRINLRREPAETFPVPALAIFLTCSMICAILSSNFLSSRASGRLAACESNLKNIGVALEMYATDYQGDYPSSPDILTKNTAHVGGSYMKALPLCPACKLPYTYEVSQSRDNFTLWCGGERSHIDTGAVGMQGCWPQYTPEEGLQCR